MNLQGPMRSPEGCSKDSRAGVSGGFGISEFRDALLEVSARLRACTAFWVQGQR